MKSVFKMIAAAATLMCSSLLHAETPEMMVNGGFESGMTGWMWEEWAGKPLPGYLDREDAAEGQASFKMTLPGQNVSRYITLAAKGEPKPEKAYTLSMMLSGKDLADKSVTVRLLTAGLEKPDKDGKPTVQGWVEVPPKSGVNTLLTTGGTFDWKLFTIEIPVGSIKPKTTSVRVLITCSNVGQGVLGIDKVSFAEKEVTSAPTAKVDAAPIEGFTVQTYETAEAAVIKPVKNSPIAWDISPEQGFYRPESLPEVRLNIVPKSGQQVSWQIVDGFGKTIRQQAVESDTKTVKVAIPSNLGYYELIARASVDGKPTGEIRRSLGILPAPASAEGREPFGLWCGGNSDYPELGVRWNRYALYHGLYKKDPEGYLKETRERLDAFRKQGIRVLIYPKDHPKNISLSQKVFKDTPEAWAEVENYWKEMVRGLKGHVDAWGVINEPYRGMWDGTDDLIIKYWAMMRRAIDQEDPGTPLIGPSLNVNEPSMMAQYQELLDRGYGRLINGVELHTYTSTAMPEDIDWEGKIEHVRSITRAATGRDLPVWSTEMGVTVPYTNELFQAQYMARCFLWAKKMNLEMLLWHMYCWPAGQPQSEREYAIFRAAVNGKVSQPRPAGVTYAALTRELASANYRAQLDYLGASTRAFVFERKGEAMLALWRTAGTATVRIAVQRPSITVTDLFGRTENRATEDGILTIDASPSVQFIAAVDRQLLETQPLVKAESTVEILPGGQAAATASIANPTDAPAKVSLRWMSPQGGSVSPATIDVELKARETKKVSVDVKLPTDAAFGSLVIYARTQLNGRPAGVASLPVQVLSRAEIAAMTPVLKNDLPGVAVTLKRHDPALTQAAVQVGSEKQNVHFSSDTQDVIIPLTNGKNNALTDYDITLSDGARQQDRTHQQLSFVRVLRANGITIDGKATDWPEVSQKQVDPFVVAWRWDTQHLYLLVRVKDSTHVQRQKCENLWQDDSIQIGVAAHRPSDMLRRWVAEMAESNYTELGVALKDGATMMYRYATPHREFAPLGEVSSKDILSAVAREGDITTYEVRVPVQQLGLKPLSSGQVVRGSVTINRNDGERRTYWEWFSGIAGTKQPLDYGHLILE